MADNQNENEQQNQPLNMIDNKSANSKEPETKPILEQPQNSDPVPIGQPNLEGNAPPTESPMLAGAQTNPQQQGNQNLNPTSVAGIDMNTFLPFLHGKQPLPSPIPVPPDSMNIREFIPFTDEEKQSFLTDPTADLTSLNNLVIDPTKILEPYQSIYLVKGIDVDDWSMMLAPPTFLVLSSSPQPIEDKRHLFTVTPHVEPPKCCTCCPECEKSFEWQILYKAKNQTFASIYRTIDCPCCLKCCGSCYNCVHCCDSYEDISTVRITKFPRLKYMRISKNLGATAIPTSCGKKCCGPDSCCDYVEEAIDYYNLDEQKFKYRLGNVQKIGNCKPCSCGGCSPCCLCCLFGICCFLCANLNETMVKGFDLYSFIYDLQNNTIAGYVVLRDAPVGSIPGCCDCCTLPETFYPSSHIQIYFPANANGLDKFMILNLVVDWIFRHPTKKMGFPLTSPLTPEELRNFVQPSEAEMALYEQNNS